MPRKIVYGENDLFSQKPDLMKEWDYKRNTGLNPKNLAVYSNKRVWWICSKCGHSWDANINNRSAGGGCPRCATSWNSERLHQLLSKKGTLVETHPLLAREWDTEKNHELTPHDITAGSNKKVWWRCALGHSYETQVCNRVAGRNCPICAGKTILPGYNDLFTLFPDSKLIWDFEKNTGINPLKLAAKSHKAVWWKCENGHSWNAKISHVTDGHGCPYCAGQKAIAGQTDIQTTNPELALEWDYEKNKVDISTVMASSGRKYWWKCCFGHSWSATAAHRNTGEGCPICASVLRTSFPEKAVYYYIHHYFKDATENYRDAETIDNFELDIFVPSGKFAVEYDGEFYHQNILRDMRKDELCQKAGIRLYRLREPKCPVYGSSSTCIRINDISVKSLEAAIKTVLRINSVLDADVDINRDYPAIDGQRVYGVLKNSFATAYPDLISEWDMDKNGNLTPYNVTKASGRKVWWRCKKCDYSWQAIIANRGKGSGCPECAKRGASERASIREKKKRQEAN